MELKLGAQVWTSDGNQAGRLRYIVLNTGSQTLDSIVVERGFFGLSDKVIDAENINEVSDDGGRIDLNVSEADLANAQEYVEANYIVAGPDGRFYNSDSAGMGDSVADPYGSMAMPVVGNLTTGIGTPPIIYPVGTGLFDTPTGVTQPIEPSGMATNAENVPTIKEGMAVNDQSGRKIGGVSRVELDSEGRLSRLAIAEGFLFTHESSIPAAWIDSIENDGIYLKYSKDEVQNMNTDENQVNNTDVTSGEDVPTYRTSDVDNGATIMNTQPPIAGTDTTNTRPAMAQAVGNQTSNYNTTSANTNYQRNTTTDNTTFTSDDFSDGTTTTYNNQTTTSYAATPTVNTTDTTYTQNQTTPVNITSNTDYTQTAPTDTTTTYNDNQTTDSYDSKLSRAAAEGPVTPATNPISEEIAGESQNSFTGTQTNEYGDRPKVLRNDGNIDPYPIIPINTPQNQ